MLSTPFYNFPGYFGNIWRPGLLDEIWRVGYKEKGNLTHISSKVLLVEDACPKTVLVI